jgi:hypothetical protein
VEQKHHISSTTNLVLQDISEMLKTFHAGQQMLSFELTLTLPICLPMFELIILFLTNLRNGKLWRLDHALAAGINKLQEYYSQAQRTQVYVLAIGKYYHVL